MNRRKRQFIRTDLQIKIVLVTLFVASLVLLINFQLGLSMLWRLSSQPSISAEGALDQMRNELAFTFLVSVAFSIPLSICVGLLYSFKFAGPIHRFKSYFIDLVAGRWDVRCTLRRGDDLSDVCDAINSGVGILRERIRESHEMLGEAGDVLSTVAGAADEAGKAKVGAILEKIERERQIFRERFPDPKCAGGEDLDMGVENRKKDLVAQD
jgi:methyl-accepting chemotaxis protein